MSKYFHFPSNVAQHEAYSKFAPMAIPTKCGKLAKQRTVVLEEVTCPTCQSKIFPKGK